MSLGVLITGGSRGIGAEMVRAFSGSGYRVAFVYRSSHDAAQTLAQECGAAAICADVSVEEDVKRAVREARAAIGNIDVLINNAGIAHFSLFTDIAKEQWDSIMNVNVGSVFLFCREILPEMISRKRGKIINVSSVWGITGSSCEVCYSTSKAALIGLTKALAKEEGPSGICVNCIAPGVINTEMNNMLGDDVMEELREETPIGRIGETRDVAKLALFLAGDGGDFITGQVISPNGGFLI